MDTNPEQDVPLSDDDKRFLAALDADMRPYLRDRKELLSRLQRLVNLAKSVPDELQRDDILRSVVVLTHAYLEDFLRTLTRHFIPVTTKGALNEVPLAGTKDRSKFQLGDLVPHLGKSVIEVIRDSVDQYLERSTFNNTDEIAALLEKLNFDVSPHSKYFPNLNTMIRRRHTIVHRADRTAKDDNSYELQRIEAEQVTIWLQSTHGFMDSVLGYVSAIFHGKRYVEVFGGVPPNIT
jgi:RiboL-PSP-HEPN